MAEEKLYKIVITRPAKNRYQETVLPYIAENYSFTRALEIDERILGSAKTLRTSPKRGTNEKYLSAFKERFKFLLHRETNHFEIKIIYFIDEAKSIVYITDFFPTKMNPQKTRGKK